MLRWCQSLVVLTYVTLLLPKLTKKYSLIIAKVHAHNMVHVEVWLGEGEKTIGSRWKDGK